jgi:hypothetical protein
MRVCGATAKGNAAAAAYTTPAERPAHGCAADGQTTTRE